MALSLFTSTHIASTSSHIESAAKAGWFILTKVPEVVWVYTAFLNPLDAPIKTSSNPSPFISATAKAGPSVETICGINGSLSNSLKTFSWCL
ncbi:hypothetical protein D3C87_1832900 [compost metagenome]